MMWYSVLLSNGFAIIKDDSNCLVNTINEQEKICIATFTTIEEAYVFACEKFVNRWCLVGNKSWATLPSMESFLNGAGVFESPFLPKERCTGLDRWFAAMNLNACACLDNVNDVQSFLLQCPNEAVIIEGSGLTHVQEIIEQYYKSKILPMSAYLPKAMALPEVTSTGCIYDLDYGTIFAKNDKLRGFNALEGRCQIEIMPQRKLITVIERIQ